jgi:two-component system phosphate regulon sensor histidine kinase PhoR
VRDARLLGTAALIGSAPLAVLGALVAVGTLALAHGLAAATAVLLAAILLARLWLGEVDRLAEALRRAAEGQALPAAAPRLSALGGIEAELARLSRALDDRAALVGRLRAADQAILEALPDPLLVLAADAAPLRANRAARRLFALGEDSLAGGGLGALLRHPALAAALDRALAGAGPQAVEVALPGPLSRDLSAHVVPMEPPLADGGRLLVVLADRSAARAMERMRADFVSNASHELRTPLASLMGFIETLRGPARDDPAARERFLGIMAEQGERMRRLIDDLLGLSRVEATEHLPPAGDAELVRLLRAEAAAMEPLFARRAVRLSLELGEAPLLAAPADADQVAQVARNLLDNALRHAAATVVLSAGAAAQAGRAGVWFAVRDDGPGVAREHLPRLTERFYRVDKGRARSAGNTGLGLAIVKHILARHRGHLLIESEPGAGACFRAWWPGATPEG